jgi:hypothetical protein
LPEIHATEHLKRLKVENVIDKKDGVLEVDAAASDNLEATDTWHATNSSSSLEIPTLGEIINLESFQFCLL